MPEDDYFHNDPNVFYTETNVVGEDTETFATGLHMLKKFTMPE